MYNIIIALIASIKPIMADYSADGLSRLIDLEKIADDYELYNRIDTRYSDMAEIDTITDSLIIDVQLWLSMLYMIFLQRSTIGRMK